MDQSVSAACCCCCSPVLSYRARVRQEEHGGPRRGELLRSVDPIMRGYATLEMWWEQSEQTPSRERMAERRRRTDHDAPQGTRCSCSGRRARRRARGEPRRAFSHAAQVLVVAGLMAGALAVTQIYDETLWTKQLWAKWKLDSATFSVTPTDENPILLGSSAHAEDVREALQNSLDGPGPRAVATTSK